MSAALDSDLDSFRAQARAWLKDNFPAALAGKGAMMSGEGGPAATADFTRWKKAMGERGWGTPTWPQAYGGGGLSKTEARVLQEEMSRIGAFSPIGGMGVMMFGPTLLEFGNEAQKTKYIPGIATGKVWWCQGYSEPGAGSDLASLRMQCVDKGDHYLVNGQKIWTSGAQYADMCFALVRTDNTRKHEGISFILIDMKQPGVEVRPILLISGNSPFCETFFTDVKVPKENLVGPLNGGWEIGKRLLQFERSALGSNIGGAPGLGRGGEARTLDQVAKKYAGANDNGKIADADLRARIAANLMDTRAFMLTVQRAASESKANQGPSATTSIMKNAGSRIGQDRAELLIEMMGHQGLGWDGAGFSQGELDTVRGWLGGKATTIYGGSQEIQNNIIAKRILGLLDHQ